MMPRVELTGDDCLNLRANSSQDGEDDTSVTTKLKVYASVAKGRLRNVNVETLGPLSSRFVVCFVTFLGAVLCHLWVVSLGGQSYLVPVAGGRWQVSRGFSRGAGLDTHCFWDEARAPMLEGSHLYVFREKFVAGVVHSFTGCAEDSDKLLSFSNVFVGVNGCSLKTVENLEVVKGIPVERMMTEMDSSYCDIKNTHAGIRYVKSSWPSKKKDKHDQECLVKGRNEPCLVRVFFPHDLDSAAEALLDSGNEAL
ncbi:putative deoxyribonuclease TATDN1 [Capsicum chinense]|nr:putative deoxyribonuclease TATDN1 [Capsicum chinense]